MAATAVKESRAVASDDAIPDDFVIPYYLGDRKIRISIARVGERFYAFGDLCTCADNARPLSGGLLEGTTIMCLRHGSRFDIATGAVINGPATKALKVYDVQKADGVLRIHL